MHHYLKKSLAGQLEADLSSRFYLSKYFAGRSLVTVSLLFISLFLASAVNAEPDVSGSTVTFPTADGWYQIQKLNYEHVCQDGAGGKCENVADGQYFVTNLKDGKRWTISVPNNNGGNNSGNSSLPTTSGSTVTFPTTAGWYQLQTFAFGNICGAVAGGKCENVADGQYYVTNTSNAQRWTVTVDAGSGEGDGDVAEFNNNRNNGNNANNPSQTNPIAGLKINGSDVSWSNQGNKDYYQIQRISNNVQACAGNISSCYLTPGVYRIVNHSDNLRLDKLVIPTPNDCAANSNNLPSGYSEVYRDDFCGETVSPNFFVPPWGIANRATRHRNVPGACVQSGGILNLKINNVGGDLQSCYLISHQGNFGPGDNSTLKIEYRANVSEVQAHGAWLAGWLYPVGNNNSGKTYGDDNSVSTGVEFDVFEYLAVRDNHQIAMHDPDSYDNIIDKDHYQNLGITPIDLTKNQYHTFAMEWNKDCVVFSIDGNVVDRRTENVSKQKAHSIYLTMEGQTGEQWDHIPVGNLGNNLMESKAVGKFDWVRVLKKDSIDSNLCN